MYWRFIDTGASDAFMNMAIDEAISIAVRQGLVQPTLRLYQWSSPSVSIGLFQRVGDIDLSLCRLEGIAIVRRPTGGRAILHGNDLTYSFSASSGIDLSLSEGSRLNGPSGLLKTYYLISRVFQDALSRLGVPLEMKTRRERGRVLTGSALCFQSVSYAELTLFGKKLIGSAQRRWSDGFLQQGTLLLYNDNSTNRRIFKEEKTIESMIGLLDVYPSIRIEDLKESLRRAFEETFSVKMEDSGLTDWEYSLARTLCKEKYSTEDWLHKR